MIDQTDFAAQLGITVERVRELRRTLGLREGRDFLRNPEDRRSIVLTPDGEAAIRAEVGVAAEAITAPGDENRCPDPRAPEKPSPEAAREAPKPETLVVTSVPRPWPDGSVRHTANPRLVQARRSNGEAVWVRVADCRHFVPTGRNGQPMPITAAFGGEPAHWYHVGRCPRWVGKY